MEIKDFQSWVEEKKGINNNLAVPLYRRFCKEYGIKFHFGSVNYPLEKNILYEIRHTEMPLSGSALALFNLTNQHYHTYKDSFVRFAYTSWDDFDYKIINAKEIVKRVSEKENEIVKLKALFITCYVIAQITTFVLAVLIFSNLLLVLPAIFIIGISPWLVYILGKRLKCGALIESSTNLNTNLKIYQMNIKANKLDL